MVTGCDSISAFASLVGILIGNAVRLKNYTITAGIKNCQSIISKPGRNHDKIVLLAEVMSACAPNLLICAINKSKIVLKVIEVIINKSDKTISFSNKFVLLKLRLKKLMIKPQLYTYV